MKQTTTQLIALLTLVLFSLSCSKKKDIENKPEIDETSLTTCPPGASCSYFYTDQADLRAEFPSVTTGSYRIFSREVTTPGISSFLYIKAPMQGDTFSMTKADMLKGLVTTSTVCPACFSVPFKPVDGYVKGIKLKSLPNRPNDTKWLIEAKLIRQTGTTPVYTDTIYVKQYFYPGSVSHF